jgi:hypothetical protein
MRLTLPDPTEPEALLSFWIAISILGGVSVAGAVAALGGSAAQALALGVLVTAVVSLLGYLSEPTAARLYRAWNRAARGYGRITARLVTGVWYWTAFTTAAATGDSGRLRAERASWQPRGTLPTEGYGDLGFSLDRRSPDDDVGGTGDYVRWITRSGRYWAITLVPLLWTLQALDTRKDRPGSESNVYTLY